MQKGVRATNPDYDRLSPKWARCADAVAGQDAMRAAGETYIPKLAAETDADYRARLARSDYFNASWRTISALTGMAFRKPPTVDVPGAIEAHLGDIDLAGCPLDNLAKGLVEDALQFGPFALLVDFPPMPENVEAITVAVAEQMGLRPAIKYYPIRSVTNWRYGKRGNRVELVQAVLKETADIRDTEFEAKFEDRWRVLDIDEAGHYRQRVYRINQRGEDELVDGPIYPVIRGQRITGLPFRIFGAMDDPPMIDLIDANIAYYQINSHYRHGLHFTSLPTLLLSGIQDEPGKAVYIGGQTAIITPDPAARGMFIEFSGKGLGEVTVALMRAEQRMALLGARMLADESRQAETLGATQIKRVGENSVLAVVVQEVSRAVEWALGIFANWAGANAPVKYEISREFVPQMLDAQRLTALMANVQAGYISHEEYYELLQRGDVIDGQKPFDEHQREVQENGPAPARPLLGVAA